PWAKACNDDGTFKSASDLQALYGGAGITADKPVIAYCRIGERSSLTWFVLKHLLGFQNVKNYDGSWTEWGHRVATPVEKREAADTGRDREAGGVLTASGRTGRLAGDDRDVSARPGVLLL